MPNDPPATPLTDDQLRAIADLATGLDGEGMPHVARALRALLAEVASLRTAVREHHDQRGDDRCHLDDQKLYHAVLGEGADPYAGALPPDEDMLESCRRYIQQRRCPGPAGVAPLPGGMTIVQLSAEVDRLRAERLLAPGGALWNVFHRAWTSAVGTAGYDKGSWMAIETELTKATREEAERG
jgi:hypothetical protein